MVDDICYAIELSIFSSQTQVWSTIFSFKHWQRRMGSFRYAKRWMDINGKLIFNSWWVRKRFIISRYNPSCR